MNLSTGRVLIIVALTVAGLAVLANGFADSGTSAAASLTPSATSPGPSPTKTQEPPPSESPTPTPTPNKTGVVFMALNGTDVPGAGAAAQDLLTSDGYTASQDAVNAPTQGVPKTTIYYRPDRDGQNESDAHYVARKYFEGAAVKKLDTDIKAVAGVDEAAIVVVVGEDWATKITT